jgi:hypothetical protein
MTLRAAAELEMLSSPLASLNIPKRLKTIEIKGENNRVSSYGQFSKIELEMKRAGPAASLA